jgi:hypothetical protein
LSDTAHSRVCSGVIARGPVEIPASVPVLAQGSRRSLTREQPTVRRDGSPTLGQRQHAASQAPDDARRAGQPPGTCRDVPLRIRSTPGPARRARRLTGGAGARMR